MTTAELRTLALTFPESIEMPHFEKTSFRVKKKTRSSADVIFATMDEKAGTATLKLTELQQASFCAWDLSACYPVPNKWGKQGWTIIVLSKIEEEFAQDILKEAYCNVAPKKLVELLHSFD